MLQSQAHGILQRDHFGLQLRTCHSVIYIESSSKSPFFSSYISSFLIFSPTGNSHQHNAFTAFSPLPYSPPLSHQTYHPHPLNNHYPYFTFALLNIFTMITHPLKKGGGGKEKRKKKKKKKKKQKKGKNPQAF